MLSVPVPLRTPLQARTSSSSMTGGGGSAVLPAANVLIFGTGVVGSEVIRQARALASLPRLAGAEVRVVGLANRRSAVFDTRGVANGEIAELCRRPAGKSLPTALDVVAWRTHLETLSRLPGPVLVDCTDACGMEAVYEEALARGIHVVTANKKPLTESSEIPARVKAAASKSGAQFRYEATVGAGLPIVGTLQSLVRTGDRVGLIDCAVSGTLGYLSSALRRKVPLSRALADAKARGFTEPDPTVDLEGVDVANKAVILARELGATIEREDVVVEPFVPRAVLDDVAENGLDTLERHDAACADHFARHAAGGRKPAYLARIVVEHLPGGRVVAHARAGLVGVDRRHPAATLDGGSAFVAFYTERYGAEPLVVQGAGAGGSVTAAGVLAELLDAVTSARGRVLEGSSRNAVHRST